MRRLAFALVLLAAAPALAKDHPCQRVEAACIAAGYVKGGARQGRGLEKNCVNPLLAGAVVPGVSIDPAEVQACAAKRARKRGLPPPAPPPPPFPAPRD